MSDAHKDVGRTAQIADYLISECRDRGELLTPLKLQKLLYYADAWWLALHDKELISEKFQAWVHGPVATSQYHRFKEFRWKPITSEIKKPNDLTEAEASFLNDIIDVFGSETAVALEIMTHQEDPWLDARGELPSDEPCNNYISKELTRDFYKSLVED
ncbi:MAG: Panacea domain-containing protein [Caulobacterales bacterium]|uniref:Panacea domain-containing protein n=1 Tax=Glycocaulis sp. TaxID=1969725 RepID=UPI003FA18F82